MKNLKLTLLLLVMAVPAVFAQAKVSYGVDLWSQYHWRNGLLGGGPSIQPTISVGVGNLTAGLWGNYTLKALDFGEGADMDTDARELDVFASYGLPVGPATVSVGLTGYFTRGVASNITRFMKRANTTQPEYEMLSVYEANLTASGPESFPLSASFNYNVAGDDADNSHYLQVSYPITAGDLTIKMIGGGTFGESAYYGTGKAALTELAVQAAYGLKLGSLPATVTAKLAANPYTEKFYPLVGLTITN